MPIRPSFLENLILLRSNLGPGPMLDLFGPLAFKSIQVALRMGVFENLDVEACTPSELASKIEADERGIRFLLEALEPLGYVIREGEKYRNSPMTEKWMLESSREGLRDLFHYFDDMLKRWDSLEISLRSGGPAFGLYDWYREHDRKWRTYHLGMKAIAGLLSKEVVERVEIPGARRLLDIGGSHGLYSIRFCQRYPELEATILDLPEARDFAEETIIAEGMSRRVTFRQGDLKNGDFGRNWDVILLFNLIRGFKPEELLDLFFGVHTALGQGGKMVILDQLTEYLPSKFARANNKLINLELFNCSFGDIHSPADVSIWAKSVGFSDINSFPLKRANGQGILIATKS